MRTRYAAGLAFAYLLSAAEVVAIVISLSGRAFFTEGSVAATAALIGVGTVITVVGGIVNISPSLDWFEAGRSPTPAQREAALTVHRRQSFLTVALWALTGVIVVAVKPDGGPAFMAVTLFTIMFGATATICSAFLFTQRTLRSLIAAAAPDFESRETAPGVLARLLLMWTVCSGLPTLGIAILIALRANGWIIPRDAAIEVPVLVLSLVAVMLGFRAMILVSRSISDPVGEVVEAMAEVEHGDIGRVVDVYENSEIGRLQSGFNRMVAGLSERDQLRDLFGRHVGAEVVRRAVEEGESLTGDVRDVAILFIDLVGSTQLAAGRPPQEVAEVLNDFFRIVVAAVDAHHGLINKFQGDAALAVFGTPVRIDDPATAALATARSLGTQLRRLPVDFGIGVSAGPVFAGNIGAENRYEYTVVGDAVNEAARLADLAKESDGRVLCSGAILDHAAAGERECWELGGEAVLRGRSGPTRISAPRS